MRPDIFLADAMTKKILFWLGVCAVSLLVMVRPSYAVAENPISQYNGNNVGGTCAAENWITDLTIAAQAAVVSRNCNYSALPPCTYSNVNASTLIVYGDCQNPHQGRTTDAIWSVSTRLFCVVAGVVATGGVCPDSTCPAANTLHSSGFFNIGTTANGLALASACQGGCAIKTVGSTSPPGQSLYIAAYPKIRQIRNGVWYYFAEMSYYHTGVNCSPDTPNFLSDFVGNKPDMTCAAGQQMISMSGVTKCFNSDGSATNANSASAVAAAKTLADQKIASAVAAAGTAAQQAGLGASAVEAAKTAAAAGAIVSTSTSSNPYPPGDPMNQYCVDNPDATLCQKKTACDKNPNLASCAELGTVADDVPLGIKTVTVSAITPFAVGGAGACPAPRAMVLHGHTYYTSYDTYCNFATGIKPIILVFAWLASAGLLVGGFKAA